jgi:chloride channel 7
MAANEPANGKASKNSHGPVIDVKAEPNLPVDDVGSEDDGEDSELFLESLSSVWLRENHLMKHNRAQPRSRFHFASLGGEEENALPIESSMRNRMEAHKLMSKYESLGYEQVVNVPYISSHGSRPSAKTAIRWGLTCAVGVLTAAAGVTIDKLSSLLVDARNLLTVTQSGFGLLGFMSYILFNALLVATAAFASIYWAPGAIGSGIPGVKAFLNGVDVKNVTFSAKVFAVKLGGVILCYASGLMVGPEGPMVHIGAMIGSAMMGARPPLMTTSANHDRMLRDFVSLGAAAGFAVAFGAPIGGVLFAFEEACSFWSTTLMWRALTATLVGTMSLLIFGNLLNTDRYLGDNWVSVNTGLITLSGGDIVSVEEIPLFVLIGIIGGGLGALFNSLWAAKMTALANLRLDRKKRLQLIVAISVLTSVLMYSIPAILGDSVCRHEGRFGQSSSSTESENLPSIWTRFGCSDKRDINVAASIFFANRADAIKAFLNEAQQFHVVSLVVMLAVFMPLTIVSFCQDVPGGMFLPTMINGSCMGALIGKIAALAISAEYGSATEMNLMRHCGLIGAVALLGGTLRSTVSLCVIITEGTGQTNLLLPIIITSLFARIVGNCFNAGLYDTSMHLEAVPFLSAESPAKDSVLRVGNIMSDDVVALTPLASVRDILRVLRFTKHGAFPVVDGKHGRLKGLITRVQLRQLLRLQRFARPPPEGTTASRLLEEAAAAASANPGSPQPSLLDDEAGPSRRVVSAGLDEPLVDVGEYMNQGPHVVMLSSPVNNNNDDDDAPVGVVSRVLLIRVSAASATTPAPSRTTEKFPSYNPICPTFSNEHIPPPLVHPHPHCRFRGPIACSSASGCGICPCSTKTAAWRACSLGKT